MVEYFSKARTEVPPSPQCRVALSPGRFYRAGRRSVNDTFSSHFSNKVAAGVKVSEKGRPVDQRSLISKKEKKSETVD